LRRSLLREQVCRLARWLRYEILPRGGPLDDRTVLAMRVHALAGAVAAGSDQAGAYVI